MKARVQGSVVSEQDVVQEPPPGECSAKADPFELWEVNRG